MLEHTRAPQVWLIGDSLILVKDKKNLEGLILNTVCVCESSPTFSLGSRSISVLQVEN